jgi:hypothetical protein
MKEFGWRKGWGWKKKRVWVNVRGPHTVLHRVLIPFKLIPCQ